MHMHKIDGTGGQDLLKKVRHLLVMEDRVRLLLSDRELQRDQPPSLIRGLFLLQKPPVREAFFLSQVRCQAQGTSVPGCHEHIPVLSCAAHKILHMKLGPPDIAPRDLTKIKMQEIKKILLSVLQTHMQQKIVPDLLIGILPAVIVVGLHQIRIPPAQDPVMLFDQRPLLFRCKGRGPSVVNKSIVAQNMGIAQHGAAAAEIIFLTVPPSEGFSVEFSGKLVCLLLHIHAEAHRHRDSRIPAQRYALHQLREGIDRISLGKRVVFQKDRDRRKGRRVGQRRHGCGPLREVRAPLYLLHPVFGDDRV